MLGLGKTTGGAAVATTDFIPLVQTDPGEAAAMLTKLYATPAAGGPTIEPVKTGNLGLMVKGTPDQIIEIKKALRSAYQEPIPDTVSGNGGTGTILPNSRTIDIGDANPAVVAELLGRALERMGKKVEIRDPFNFAKPAQSPTPTPGNTTPMTPGIPTPGNSTPGISTPGTLTPPRTQPNVPPMPAPTNPPIGTRQPLPGRDPIVPTYPIGAQIVDPDKGAKKADKPVIITIKGNKLEIQSEDPAALDVLASLIRLYKPNAPPSDNIFRVIPLKYIAAEDAARELSEIFNGPPPQQQGGGGRGGLNPLALLGLGGLGGGGAVTAPTPGRVRVVAEKTSNSLIVVRANQHDLLLIEQLLASAIDGGRTDSAAVLKTFILPVKNADAAEMASTIREVYRYATTSTGGQPQIGGLPFFAALGGRGGGLATGGTAQQQQPPALSISTDDRSNSIILVCAETLFRDIEALVTQLDNATTSTTEVVQLVQLKGVDPNLVQQAINAMQGRDTRNLGNMGGFGNRGPGGGGFGGPGGGGFGGLGGGGFGGLGGGGLGGGGFPGLGGGGFGGGGFGGGGNRGGGFGGGGFGGGGNRGGGGGGGGNRGGGGGFRPGGGRQANLGTQGGPLNFDYRGMDAPSAPVSKIYDPEVDTPDFGYNRPKAAKSFES